MKLCFSNIYIDFNDISYGTRGERDKFSDYLEKREKIRKQIYG